MIMTWFVLYTGITWGLFVSIAMALYTHAFDRAFAAAKSFLGVLMTWGCLVTGSLSRASI